MSKNKDGYQIHIAAEKKENKPSMERFPLNDSADSTSALPLLLAQRPAFRLEKAVP